MLWYRHPRFGGGGRQDALIDKGWKAQDEEFLEMTSTCWKKQRGGRPLVSFAITDVCLSAGQFDLLWIILFLPVNLDVSM